MEVKFKDSPEVFAIWGHTHEERARDLVGDTRCARAGFVTAASAVLTAVEHGTPGEVHLGGRVLDVDQSGHRSGTLTLLEHLLAV